MNLPRRRQAIAMAVARKDLAAVRELLAVAPAGAANTAQRVVIHGFAALLETDSAGLSILFERFDRRELGNVERALEAVGAIRVAADFQRLKRVFAAEVVRTRSRFDAADELAGKLQTRRIDAKRAAHVEELKACLLRYAAGQVERLAAAPRA